jgi:hypothetical protein
MSTIEKRSLAVLERKKRRLKKQLEALDTREESRVTVGTEDGYS